MPTYIKSMSAAVLTLLLINGAYAQEGHEAVLPGRLFNEFDRQVGHPLDMQNTAAPAALSQFHFMIGIFQCHDSLLVNGQWQESRGTWESSYTLNGFAIEDQYRNENYAGMSIRIYDPKLEQWAIYFFGMPGNHQGVWYGQKEGNKMIMRQERKSKNGSMMESRLTFYNISEEAFKWKGESVDLSTSTSTINWKISAERVSR